MTHVAVRAAGHQFVRGPGLEEVRSHVAVDIKEPQQSGEHDGEPKYLQERRAQEGHEMPVSVIGEGEEFDRAENAEHCWHLRVKALADKKVHTLTCLEDAGIKDELLEAVNEAEGKNDDDIGVESGPGFRRTPPAHNEQGDDQKEKEICGVDDDQDTRIPLLRG